jgi:hypothetical protein
MGNLLQAAQLLDTFRAGSLRSTVAKIQGKLEGASKASISPQLSELGIGMELMLAALLVKRTSSQINEIVHAVGILLVLPALLEDGETVVKLSLAAGNTGNDFDLETNKRVAEFTFIDWQGGAEVIRQNKILKDFHFLAEAETDKRRELFVAGLEHPQKFFESGRSLPAILRGNNKLGTSFLTKYGDRFKTVREYYVATRHLVAIRDLCEFLPVLKSS